MMSNIIVLNPLILGSFAADGPGAKADITGAVLGIPQVLTIAPLMTWPEAMGPVVVNGLVIVLLASGFRTAVFNAVPRELKATIAVGIGLFIGLVDAGFVRRLADAANTTVPWGWASAGRARPDPRRCSSSAR